MATGTISKLDRIALIVDAKAQSTELKTLIESTLSDATEELTVIASRVLQNNNEFSQQVARAAALQIVGCLKTLPAGELFLNTSLAVLQQLSLHAGPYDEADYHLRKALFQFYLDQGLYHEAAATYSRFNIESTTFPLTDAEKVDVYLSCAEAFLFEKEPSDAEPLVNTISKYINGLGDNSKLQLRYRMTTARVLDANRKFIDAAQRYYDLSNSTDPDIADDLPEIFGLSITCAILAKAGPQRTRILNQLMKDKRLEYTDKMQKFQPHIAVLVKMGNDQLLHRDDLASFESTLQEHQLALTREGFTIPVKAMIEHNMQAAGKIYDNIHFSQLAVLLGLEKDRTEKLAATMITEGRLKATIDQTACDNEGCLIFDEDATNLTAWDARIRDVCDELMDCFDHAQLRMINKA